MPSMPVMASTASYHIKEKPSPGSVSTQSGEATCAVCGDSHAKVSFLITYIRVFGIKRKP